MAPSNQGSFVAEILRASARGYAAQAATELLNDNPASAARSSRPFLAWQDHLAERIHELAAAVHIDEPTLFASYLTWARTAYEAREVSIDELRASLGILEGILSEGLPEHAAPMLEPYFKQAREALDAPLKPVHRLEATDPLSTLTLKFLEAALAGDRQRAVKTIITAADAGVTTVDLYENVLIRAESEVGTMWHMGEITVAEEHVVTATARDTMATLAHHCATSDAPTRTALGAVVETDHHDMGLIATMDLLEMDRWRSVNLGPNVPVSELSDAMSAFSPNVVILSAMMGQHLDPLRRTIEAIREAHPDMPIIVGGRILSMIPTLWKKLGATACASRPAEAVTLAAARA